MKMREFVQRETAVVTVVAEGVVGRVVSRVNVDQTRRMLFGNGCASAAAVAILVMLALLAGCESNTPQPPPAKPEPKPPELLTGRAAFQKVFIAARNYAADVKPFRIESTPSVDGNGQEGKSAIWRASFASALQHGVKPFIWSGSNAPDAPSRGVSPGNEDT